MLTFICMQYTAYEAYHPREKRYPLMHSAQNLASLHRAKAVRRRTLARQSEDL